MLENSKIDSPVFRYSNGLAGKLIIFYSRVRTLAKKPSEYRNAGNHFLPLLEASDSFFFGALNRYTRALAGRGGGRVRGVGGGLAGRRSARGRGRLPVLARADRAGWQARCDTTGSMSE